MRMFTNGIADLFVLSFGTAWESGAERSTPLARVATDRPGSSPGFRLMGRAFSPGPAGTGLRENLREREMDVRKGLAADDRGWIGGTYHAPIAIDFR